MQKLKKSPAFKSAILYLAVIVALIFVIGHSSRVLARIDYFKIKHITANKPDSGFDFSYLLGRNIFDIDLKKESRYISELYPVYKNIRLFRLLPDRLFINFNDRRALACIRSYKYFCVDSDLILFDLPKPQEAPDLPLIIGLERKIPAPRAGKQYKVKELVLAMDIVQAAETNNLLRKARIMKIDVTSLANISFFIQPQNFPGGVTSADSKALEVKIGQDKIAEKISVLAGLLSQSNGDIVNIKYIDLRFKEAVVKYNEAKK